MVQLQKTFRNKITLGAQGILQETKITLVDIIYGPELVDNTYELKLVGIIYVLKSIGIHTTNIIKLIIVI